MYYWSLVESYRSEGKVKQRVLQSLGNTQTALMFLQGNPRYGTYFQQIRQFLCQTGEASSYATRTAYFVYTNSPAETEAIRHVQPKHLLLSYFYFRNRSLEEVVDKLGYLPAIMLDSGAFSAFHSGRNIAPLDYMTFIETNQHYLDHYISLDVIGDPDLTFYYYEMMRFKGFRPLPVYHYGEEQDVLDRYIHLGNPYIALGGTVPERNKRKVAQWVRTLHKKHPDVHFHLLGSSSRKIIETTPLFSCDSSTWIQQAANGKPSHIQGKSRQAKVKRAIYNMNTTLQSLGSMSKEEMP
ncbi:hypothetical protein [Thalassobacillus pellis]|uniref:hypothetical protein n=1 Tax=Thalassobacillus pellis TaxID=748008 RepID=UPI001961BB7B|nr:hypothetical protein [Thalassobacillus pellis]MBM7554523.1 hypothetical protein [Thalassobacillus pellis]